MGWRHKGIEILKGLSGRGFKPTVWDGDNVGGEWTPIPHRGFKPTVWDGDLVGSGGGLSLHHLVLSPPCGMATVLGWIGSPSPYLCLVPSPPCGMETKTSDIHP